MVLRQKEKLQQKSRHGDEVRPRDSADLSAPGNSVKVVANLPNDQEEYADQDPTGNDTDDVLGSIASEPFPYLLDVRGHHVALLCLRRASTTLNCQPSG